VMTAHRFEFAQDGLKHFKKGARHLLLSGHAKLESVIDFSWFDYRYWAKQELLVGRAQGRNTTYFFRHQTFDYVLRHYYRGGLVRFFSRDWYWYKSLETTRPHQELALLSHLKSLNLPAPEPVAAAVTRRCFFFYQADLIIHKIAEAKDVFTLLCEREVSAHEWRRIGICIRRFHDANVYHADLNIHNILLDQRGEVYLIDFDKSYLRDEPGEWRTQNLERLQRSLEKEKRQQDHFAWESASWSYLLNAYNSL